MLPGVLWGFPRVPQARQGSRITLTERLLMTSTSPQPTKADVTSHRFDFLCIPIATIVEALETLETPSKAFEITLNLAHHPHLLIQHAS